MTQKEIDKFLADTKVYVNGKSKEIQKKLFSFGYKWSGGNTEVIYTKYPFLFIYEDMPLTCSYDMECFSNHKNREISAEEILSLELTKPKYRPFRDKEECWNEMLKHQPFGWLKGKESQIYKDCCYVFDCGIFGEMFDAAYNYYTFADGTPFGIKED